MVIGGYKTVGLFTCILYILEGAMWQVVASRLHFNKLQILQLSLHYIALLFT